MSYQIIDEPNITETLTLDEVKNFCRIDIDYVAEDADLSMLITAARVRLEAYLNIGLLQREVTVQWSGYPLELPLSPTGEITEVTGKDGAITTDNYTISSYQAKRMAINAVSGSVAEWFYHDGYVEPWSWETPCNDAMYSVKYETGYEQLPSALKNAWLSEVDYLFKLRGFPVVDVVSPNAAILANSYSRNLIL